VGRGAIRLCPFGKAVLSFPFEAAPTSDSARGKELQTVSMNLMKPGVQSAIAINRESDRILGLKEVELS